MKKTYLCGFYFLLCFSGFVSQAQVFLLNENFNGNGIPAGWVKINNSTGGDIGAADWTLRNDGYTYSSFGVSPPETFHSNDNSSFYLTNSDEQEGDTTETILRSPSFSTVGYSYVTIKFYHYFWEYLNDSAFVEVSTNGTTWTVVATYKYPVGQREGLSTSFVQKTVNLNNYAGNPTVYIRFRYYAEFGYYWAIDNVSVSGSTTNPCAINYWEGSQSTAWENPGNWSCGTVPDANTIVNINPGKPNYPVINSIATCKTLNSYPATSVIINNGSRLDITGP